MNADGTGPVKLPIPETGLVLDCSRDGRWPATRTMSGEAAHNGQLTLVHPDGTEARNLTEGSAKDDQFSIFRISPDGQNIAYVEIKTENEVPHSRLFVIGIDGKNRREIPTRFDPGTMAGVCWSPDGSRLALNPIDTRTKEGSIALIDLDGSNFRNLPLPPGRWNIHVCDWSKLTSRPPRRRPQADPGSENPPRPIRALLAECKKASRAFQEEYKTARTDEERNKIKREKAWQPRPYLARFLAIAESAPNDPAAVDSLLWVVQFGSNGPEFARAIDQLGRITPTGAKSVSQPPVWSTRCHQRWKNSSVRSSRRARTSRSRRWHPSRWAGSSSSSPCGSAVSANLPNRRSAGRPCFSKKCQQGELRSIHRRDPDSLLKEAESVFERTIKEFAGSSRRGDSISADARAELFEIRELCAGKRAPEIQGQDFAGKPLKLSDFKGKGVVIDFWSTSCGACKDMSAYERSLMKKMQGKPLAVVGVNCDDNEHKLAEWIKKEGHTWRSWRDGNAGNAEGPIFRQFNIHTWPTIYIVDQRGIIRHKFLGFPGVVKLDAAIDELVKEAIR